jgi:hypothetical protein
MLRMDTRRILFQVVAISLAAYGILVLVNASETINAIMLQSNYYSTGGGHAIMLATTIAIGIGVLCIIPSILILIGIAARKRQLKRDAPA